MQRWTRYGTPVEGTTGTGFEDGYRCSDLACPVRCKNTELRNERAPLGLVDPDSNKQTREESERAERKGWPRSVDVNEMKDQPGGREGEHHVPYRDHDTLVGGFPPSKASATCLSLGSKILSFTRTPLPTHRLNCIFRNCSVLSRVLIIPTG